MISSTETHAAEGDEQLLAQLTEEERGAFDTFLERVDPLRTRSLNVMLRFLFMCKLDVEKAEKLKNDFDRVWAEVDDKASDEDCLRELETGKYALGGVAPNGRGVMHCYAELHVPADFDVDVMVKTSFLVMDMVMTDPAAAKNGLLWVCWMQNTGWKNFDVRYQRRIVQVFEVFGDAAMNMLGDMHLVSSPWWVRLALAICRPIIGPEIMKVIKSQTPPEVEEELGDSLQVKDSFGDRMRRGDLHRWQ